MGFVVVVCLFVFLLYSLVLSYMYGQGPMSFVAYFGLSKTHDTLPFSIMTVF